MQRRTFIQGLLALPLIGVAAKAFSVPVKTKLELFDISIVKSGGEPIKQREVSHVIFFNRERIKQKGWVDMVPIMVLYDKKAIPMLVLEQCDAAIDMEKMRCVKHRYDHTLSAWTDREHEGFAFTSYSRACFHMGDKGPYELTDEIRVKNKLAFANLREAKTGEML